MSVVPRLQILAAAVLFSTGGAAIKATSLTSWQVASFRSGIAALTLLVLLPSARRGWSGKSIGVGVIYAATLICYVTANKLTTAGNAIFLQSTAPLYLLLLGPWLLAERVRRRDIAFMGAIAAGLALFFFELEAVYATAPDPLRGNIIAAASGLLWALTLLALRWLSRDGGESASIPAVVVGNLIACVAILPLALPVVGASTADWTIMLWLGIFQIGLAYIFMTRGLTGVPALEASLLILVEPVLNSIWAWWIHGERPGPLALAGSAVILATTILKTVVDARSAGAGKPPD